MNKRISFGYNVPVFAGAIDDDPNQAHYNVPEYEELSWSKTEAGILKAEELGYDSIWCPDHLLIGHNNAEYECWTMLSAIAGMTDDIRIGSLVLCNDFRNPALLAKMAATLDIVSNGRLELGLGAGWNKQEYDSYGWEFRDGFTRLMRLDESIQLLKKMWTENTPTFVGGHYQIEDAYCEPPPVQDPHPPVIVGGAGEQVTLKLVAKHADGWNLTQTRGHPHKIKQKLSVLQEHCETVGRDYGSIEKSWECLVLCTRDNDKLDRIRDSLVSIIRAHNEGTERATPTRETLDEYLIIGSPEECAAAIETRIELGMTKFQCWFVDYPDFDGMELFADEVIPQFR